LAVLFLVVLLLVAGVGGGIYLQTGSALESETRADLTRATELQANTLAQWMSRVTESAQYISSSEIVAGDNQTRTERRLESELEHSPPSVVAIHYYDLEAKEVLASTEPDVGEATYRTAGVEWANETHSFANATHAKVTHPFIDPVTNATAMAVLSRTRADADRAIVLIVDLETLTNQLERPSNADGAFTHVVNEHGTVVLSHHQADINTQNIEPDDGSGEAGHDDGAGGDGHDDGGNDTGHDDGGDGHDAHDQDHADGVDSPAVERGLQGDSGYAEMDVGHGHGETMTMGYAPVPGTNWVVMTHVPKSAAYSLQTDIERSVIALVVLAMLGLGAVGAVIVRNTTKPIERLADRASALEAGNLDTELETTRADEIGQLYGSFEAMRNSLREQIREVEAARSRTERMNRHLEGKANEYSEVMHDVGEGDLTRRMDPESENDAMAAIAVDFNQMIADIEATLDHAAQFASEVAASSEEATASTEEVHSASVQMTESIEEISYGAERQHRKLTGANEEMSQLSTTTEEIAASSNNVADLAERTAETGQQGRRVANETLDAMADVEGDMEATIDAIESLEDEIAQIDELVEFISSVAHQTNMLALNANIEATRTTEGTEGFSAVATEVKELAEETKQAADDIETQIEEIKTQTHRTTSEVRETQEGIATYRSAVENTVDALEQIAAYADETSRGVQEISAATEQQAASTQEVVAMVDEAVGISEETTAEAETVVAAGVDALVDPGPVRYRRGVDGRRRRRRGVVRRRRSDLRPGPRVLRGGRAPERRKRPRRHQPRGRRARPRRRLIGVHPLTHHPGGRGLDSPNTIADR
jgi:methyl-accepting chemotaxis protein